MSHRYYLNIEGLDTMLKVPQQFSEGVLAPVLLLFNMGIEPRTLQLLAQSPTSNQL